MVPATVTFSMPPISAVEVLVESWEYASGYTLTFENVSDSITFDVPEYPAHYTITTSFQGDNGIYHTTFVFHIGTLDNI